MADFWGGLGNAIGGFASGVGALATDVGSNAYKLATGQGNSINWNNTINAANYNPYATPKAPSAPTPGSSTYTSGSSSSDAYYQALLKQAQDALAAARTPTPRFINYDISGSWNKARQMAEQAVSPIYQQKMTDFINRQATELARQQEDTVTGKAALDQAQQRLLEDTAVQRGRTQEDTDTNIKDIQDTQAFNTRQESLNFDAANRALTEGVGAGNLAESGLGQQQIQENQQVRREQSNETIRQMNNKVEAANTLMNRTFEDLGTKEQRGEEDTTAGKTKLDVDLERFIEDQAYNLDQEQKSNELAKQADIANKSIGLQGQLVDQWLASLSGQGYTAQEIANAASMYK